MVFDGIILAVIVGYLRKGSLKSLATLKLKFGWVFPLLLLVQIAVFSLQNEIPALGQASGFIFMLVYIAGLFFLAMNWHYKGFAIIFIGVFLNFLVMAVNGGRMPVSMEAAVILDPAYIEAIKAELYAKHAVLTSSTNLGFLGDIIPLTDPYPKNQVISIGDVLMNIGIFMFIQHLMLGHFKNKPKDDVSFQLKGGETS
ncbi:DUF5317 domain-containing protein [Mesobacillus subterraneus]|uniref:DUF5317 domain-containing protein n=1 Tax=Mesobacillus subterraneus TaxID=285983 RepID=UPI002041FA56|nr:DUF5317 domain-containing protein [Mesobacillus subterraneus]MCM3574164.1 DUF5317 domain-containing protein [Mesobacillus subterraneus]